MVARRRKRPDDEARGTLRGASAASHEQTVAHAMPDSTKAASCKFRKAADRVVLGAAVRAEVREAAAGELAVPEAEVPGSADRPVLDREAAAPGPADHPVLDREVAAPVPSVPEVVLVMALTMTCQRHATLRVTFSSRAATASEAPKAGRGVNRRASAVATGLFSRAHRLRRPSRQ